MSLGPLGPMRCQVDGFVHVVFGGGKRKEMVQGHDDIRVQRYLNVHDILRREENFGPVEM